SLVDTGRGFRVLSGLRDYSCRALLGRLRPGRKAPRCQDFAWHGPWLIKTPQWTRWIGSPGKGHPLLGFVSAAFRTACSRLAALSGSSSGSDSSVCSVTCYSSTPDPPAAVR